MTAYVHQVHGTHAHTILLLINHPGTTCWASRVGVTQHMGSLTRYLLPRNGVRVCGCVGCRGRRVTYDVMRYSRGKRVPSNPKPSDRSKAPLDAFYMSYRNLRGRAFSPGDHASVIIVILFNHIEMLAVTRYPVPPVTRYPLTR